MPTVMRQQNAEPEPQMTPALPPGNARRCATPRALKQPEGKGAEGSLHRQDTYRQDG
jgi:hypothetical protein